MKISTDTTQILQPYPGVYAYYDGRINKRLYSPQPNWLDDGAYGLGTASYAIVDGDEALVYDTHISLEHAQLIRRHIEELGVTKIRVVLSHWHADHIAGNEVFADCEIIALKLTAKAMEDNRQELETREPIISPIVGPNRMFETFMTLNVGTRTVELHHFDIHSADGNVLWLEDEKLLLAGDTVEDTVTYVSEAAHTHKHVLELQRMRNLPVRRILPNHGAPDIIAAGGYGPELIDANRLYLQRLLDPTQRSKAEGQSLKDFIADNTDSAIVYCEPYEVVHRHNIDAIKAAGL